MPKLQGILYFRMMNISFYERGDFMSPIQFIVMMIFVCSIIIWLIITICSEITIGVKSSKDKKKIEEKENDDIG